MYLKIRAAVTLFGIVLFLFSWFFSLYLFPKLVKDKIEETFELKSGTDAYARWKNLPIPIQYKIYFFNISNPTEVQQGNKPKVREIGPYVYTQKRWKSEIEKDEDTLSYYQNLEFEFDATASFPFTDIDDITIPNLPLMGVLTMAEYRLFPLLPILNVAIDYIFENPTDLFLRTTPKDFLFDGIFLQCNTTDALIVVACGIIERLAPPTITRTENGQFKFSLLSHKNNTDEGRFVINSGIIDHDKLGEISSWQGSSTLKNWAPGSTCNKIHGSDSTIFPTYRTPESHISVFSVDICRSVSLEYSNDITYAGISGHRFVAGQSMLSSPSTLPSNECYCLNKTQGIRGNDGCLLDGALELLTCQEVPVVLSLPHFYLADEAYQNGVEGLAADESLHEMYVDLEPYTGTPLRGHKRAQFNIFYRPIENITLTENLTTTLMPIVWLDEGAELTDNLIDELNYQLFDVLSILDDIFWFVLSVGVIIVAANFIWFLISCRSSKKIY